jgi:repressor LexA
VTLKNLTARQGQVLAYISSYTLVNRMPPAQSDIADYFCVTGPAVHGMLTTLEKNGWLERLRGEPRAIRVLVAPQQLPVLEPSAGGPLPTRPYWG